MNGSASSLKPQLLDLNSLIAPGVVGTAAMLISNTVCDAFELYKPWPAVLYLIVALLFCLWAVWEADMGIFKKGVYCFLGALVIFSSASGQNLVGQKLISPADRAGNPKDLSSIQDSLASQPCFAHACLEYGDIEMDNGNKLIMPIVFQLESWAHEDGLRLAQEPQGWCCIKGQIKKDMTKRECDTKKGQYFLSRDEALKSCGKFFREAF